MRLMSLTAVLAGSATLCAVMSMAKEDPEAAARSAVVQQLHAIRTRDLDTAFSYASPVLQRKLGGPQRYGQMIRAEYPMIWNASETFYLRVTRLAKGIRQRVLLRDEDGQGHVLDYDLVRAGDRWQIRAIQIMPASTLAGEPV